MSLGHHKKTTSASRRKLNKMHVDIPPLPYEKDALEPYISEDNLSAHYERQIGYIQKLNVIPHVKQSHEVPLEQLILDAIELENQHLYNMASQTWNHSFFWHSLKESGGGIPSGKLAALIRRDFRTFEEFKKRFIEESKDLFGSGWEFLVFNPALDRLQIFIGKDAENPFPFKLRPIFVIDLWEHAFQCDFGNDRAEYVKTMMEHCLNWDFANDNCRRL